MADLKALLQRLHVKTAEELLARIQSADASPALFESARRFLMDNNITASAQASRPLKNLASIMPFCDPTLTKDVQ